MMMVVVVVMVLLLLLVLMVAMMVARAQSIQVVRGTARGVLRGLGGAG